MTNTTSSTAPITDGNIQGNDGSSSGEGLVRALTMKDGIGVTVGVIIGSGIFASPGQVLGNVGSTGLALVVWVAGAMLALCSSLVYCELGPAVPAAGGDRDYILLAFGPRAAFAYTFTMFFVIKSGSQGILSITFARYLMAMLYPDDDSLLTPEADGDTRVKLAAIAAVLVFTALNCAGVKDSSAVQNVLTVLKAGLLVVMVGAAGSSLATSSGRQLASANLGLPQAFDGSKLSQLGPGLVGALWAFDGWNDIVFLAEELQDPTQLPRIITTSMVIVTCVYLCVIVSYSLVLSSHDMVHTSVIALDTVQATLGSWAYSPTAALVSISVLGSLNGSVMCGGRLFYAAARGGEMPRQLARLSRRRTPAVALVAQAAVAVVILSLPGSSFNQLMAYFGSASWLWYGMTGLSLLRLRRTHPDLPRPYRCPIGAAALLVVVAAYIIGSSIADHETRLQTLVSLAFVLAAVAVHAAIEWWRHHRGQRLGSAKQRLADADSAAAAVAPDHHMDHHHVH